MACAGPISKNEDVDQDIASSVAAVRDSAITCVVSIGVLFSSRACTSYICKACGDWVKLAPNGGTCGR